MQKQSCKYFLSCIRLTWYVSFFFDIILCGHIAKKKKPQKKPKRMQNPFGNALAHDDDDDNDEEK